MGRFDFQKNGRLTRFRQSNNNEIDKSRLMHRRAPNIGRFDSRLDARSKLIQKQNSAKFKPFQKILDARDLLRSRQQKKAPVYRTERILNKERDLRSNLNVNESDDDAFENVDEDIDLRKSKLSLSNSNGGRTKSISGSVKDPLIIVTGLGNVRKEGDSVRVLKKVPVAGKSRYLNDHVVLSNGKNTLITLNNDKVERSHPSSSSSSSSLSRHKSTRERDTERENRRKKSDSEQNLFIDKTKSSYEPIKIKIKNNNYVQPEVYSMASASNNVTAPPITTYEFTSGNKMYSDNFAFRSGSNSIKTNNIETSNNNFSLASSGPSSFAYNKGECQANIRYSKDSDDDMDYENNDFDNSSRSLTKSIVGFANNLSSSSFASSSNANYNQIFSNNPVSSKNYYSSNENSYSNVSHQAPPPPSQISSSKSNINNSSNSSSNSKDGYKLLVSNLHPRVTEDDVLELFSDVGPIKRARFIDKGLAEVVYVRIEHAKEAINKYDQKELDGRQMVIGFADRAHQNQAASLSSLKDQTKPKKSLISSISSTVSHSSSLNPITPSISSSSSFLSQPRSIFPLSMVVNASSNSSAVNSEKNMFLDNNTSLSQTSVKDSLSNRFKSITKNSKDSAPSIQLPESKKYDLNYSKVAVDASIIHQVLFNKKPTINTSPVTFTVKL